VTELKTLIKALEQNPTNLDLINSVAIGYFENYDQKLDKEDFDHFEKAYNLKKTVKSTHNFAWFLYFEWSEIEWRWNQDSAVGKAFQIQKECLELNPESYFPYYQFGYMHLDQQNYKEALPYLEKANKLENHRDISHNIGFCHFQLGNYEKAKEYFSESITEGDLENKSLFNLALSEFKINNIDQVKNIAEKLSNDIKDIFLDTIDHYEIGLLFFLLKDFPNASACLIKQGINAVDLFDWKELSYSLYQTNKEAWRKRINQSIQEKEIWIEEINSGHEDWDEDSDEENKKRQTEFRDDIKSRQAMLDNAVVMPIPNLGDSLKVEYCSCLLFACKQHGNREND
jgi:tetratricopeptide (TPR) repeat protein